MYPVAAGMRSKPGGRLSSWGYGRGTHTDTKELLSFPLKTLQPTWLAAVTQLLSAVLSFTHTPWLAWKRAGCVRKPLQAAASAALLSAPRAGGTRPQHPELSGPLSLDSHSSTQGCHIAMAPGQQRRAFPPPCPDCFWPCCKPRELWSYLAHTVPPHRHSSGEETNLNLTHVHFCFKQALVTTSLQDGIFCATWSWIIVVF